MLKRWIPILLIVLLLALTACGGDENVTDMGGGASSAPSEDAADPNGENAKEPSADSNQPNANENGQPSDSEQSPETNTEDDQSSKNDEDDKEVELPKVDFKKKRAPCNMMRGQIANVQFSIGWGRSRLS